MNSWEPKKLTDVADYINGYAFGPDDWGTEGLPIIRIEQLKNPEAPADFFDGKLPARNIIDDGDLIFSWSASLFLRIWRHGKAALNQHLFKVVEKPGFDRAFLKSFIEFYLPELTKASHGSTMQHITRKELEKFVAPFPIDEAEQKNIAAVVGLLDRAIEQTEALIAKQRRIKTGLMQDLLTKGIDENGTIRSEATHEFKDSPLGRIPVEWDIDVFERITPKDAPIGYGIVQPGAFDHSGIPVAGIYTINSDFQQWHMSTAKIESAYARSRICPGDVLLSIKATIGRVGVVPPERSGNISREIARIRPIDKINPYFLRYLMLSNRYRQYLSNAEVGTIRAEISINILRELFVVIPPPPEQDEIVLRIDALERALDVGKKGLKKLHSLKTGLMHDLLTGKVRVTELLASQTSHG